MEIPVKIKSNNMELRSILFEGEDQVELPMNSEVSYIDTEADLSGFETEVILDLTVQINSTEAAEPISNYFYNKLKDLDMVKIVIKDTEVDLTEESIRRGLLKAYYKN